MRGLRLPSLLLTILLVAIAFVLQGCPSLIANVVAPGQSIQQAIDQADPGDTLKVMGSHDENVTISKDNLTLKGENGATIDGDVTVKADGVSIENIDITGVLDTPTGSFTELILSDVDLYGKILNTTLTCTAVVNAGEDLQSIVDALADGDTICLAPGVPIDGVKTGKSLTFIRISVGEITLEPVAVFTFSPEAPQAGESVTFDASNSVDPAGLRAQAIESYSWNFGDGSTGTGETVTHTYADDGKYTVTLTVTDDDGATAKASKAVMVDNPPPNASFSFSPSNPLTNETVTFDATNSGAPNSVTAQNIVSYEWEFGDGSTGSGATVIHSYADDGAYNVTVNVTDNHGTTDSVTKTVSVQNRPPQASFITDPTSGTVPLPVNFNASESVDSDGNIKRYEWSIDYSESLSGTIISHTFTFSGTFRVELTVTDDDGASSSSVADIEVTPLNPQTIYFASGSSIKRANINGENIREIIYPAGPSDVALDLEADRVYWADWGENKIARANMDGSGRQELATGLGNAQGIAVDSIGRRVYWGTASSGFKVQRANLDGSNVETLATGPGFGIALDRKEGKVYWTEPILGDIERSGLDGSNHEHVLTGGEPMGIAVDHISNKLYWTSYEDGTINRSDLDGTDREVLINGLDYPMHIELDLRNEELYFQGGNEGHSSAIYRADMDGSNIEKIISPDFNIIRGFALGD